MPFVFSSCMSKHKKISNVCTSAGYDETFITCYFLWDFATRITPLLLFLPRQKLIVFENPPHTSFLPSFPIFSATGDRKWKIFFAPEEVTAIPPSFPIFPAPPNIRRASRNDFFAKRKWVSCHLFVKGGGGWVSAPLARYAKEIGIKTDRKQIMFKKGNPGNSFSVQKHCSFFPCLFFFFSAVFLLPIRKRGARARVRKETDIFSLGAKLFPSSLRNGGGMAAVVLCIKFMEWKIGSGKEEEEGGEGGKREIFRERQRRGKEERGGFSGGRKATPLLPPFILYMCIKKGNNVWEKKWRRGGNRGPPFCPEASFGGRREGEIDSISRIWLSEAASCLSPYGGQSRKKWHRLLRLRRRSHIPSSPSLTSHNAKQTLVTGDPRDDGWSQEKWGARPGGHGRYGIQQQKELFSSVFIGIEP